ncbi:hypothetical protein C7974DRAFT_229764 [Boeremia exigua]|uniref:uncharacterized protein n=1 Tax=Boeremia exigua TaxID=749465 RepID=UPI001E8DE796|nr:uncharacterized protein C7974DRAFT_229764 [Boeremia exigua]KAH6620273.1 hypothetical protein C7974DRAFT_229764 [Boeremia exigua]
MTTMHYISPTRRKSCTACVKSKRRCDLEYPVCKRCSAKGLECAYPTTSPSRSRRLASVRETVHLSPDLSPRGASVPVAVVDSSAEFLSFNGATTDPLAQDALPFSYSSGSSSSDSPVSWQDELASAATLIDDVPLEEYAQPQLGRMLWPEIKAPCYMTSDQTAYILRTMRSFIPSMAYTGSTPFLHQALWKQYQPASYQDCVAISALYLCKTSANTSLITASINRKIACMKARAGSWDLLEHLAAVQTLIIYQIMRLFDASLQDQVSAQKHSILLETWAALLWKRSFTDPPLLGSCHDTWVLAESLRRTVMMSVFVRCAWSIYTRDGLADQVPVMSRITFTRDLRAWRDAPAEWDARVLPELLAADGLTAYEDFADEWSSVCEVGVLDPFHKLLLVACRGADDPRLFG